MASFSAVLVVLLSLCAILQVNGQPTAEVCEDGDTLISIVTDIQQMCFEEIRQKKTEEAHGCHEFFNSSFQQLKNQQHMAMTNLQAVDQRLLENVQSGHEFINSSFQQLKNQQNMAMTNIQQLKSQQDNFAISLQAVEQRLQAQDRVIQSIHGLLNSSLQLIVRRLDDQDNFTKNQSQILLKLAAVFGIDDWIVIMHRFDGSVNFNRSWTEYRNGFGDKKRGEFWLGNEQVHRLTNRFSCTLRIEVQLWTSGTWYHAEYFSFSLESESNKYALRISGFSGNAGDSITSTSLSSAGYLDGMNFTTWDSDNDKDSGSNCAHYHQGGWWFNNCEYSCLTGQYNSGSFHWYSLNHLESHGPLRAARMMIRSK